MFTGLVEALGTVRRIASDGTGRLLTITEPRLAPELSVGESVAVNGACLTVVERAADGFSFQAGPETLQRTNLGELQAGERVNLERALRLADRLGGHFVQGHIDGLGHIESRQPQGGQWELIWFTCPPNLAAQVVSKGSVAVDGISLTVIDVRPDGFSVALIPHTLANTTLGWKPVGASVNVETDLLAKYAWKFLASGGYQLPEPSRAQGADAPRSVN
jgi:riboflavin synthase